VLALAACASADASFDPANRAAIRLHFDRTLQATMRLDGVGFDTVKSVEGVLR